MTGMIGGSSFPFLFGGTFIEGIRVSTFTATRTNFPSFSEGLSLRVGDTCRR